MGIGKLMLIGVDYADPDTTIAAVRKDSVTWLDMSGST